MRNILLHSHIFKNAGTTFDYALEKYFKNDFVDHRDDKDIIEGKGRYLLQYLRKNNQIKALSSHSIHFHAVGNNEFNFYQIYFIRHPIERIMSVYNFEKKQGSEVSLGGKMANELNFNDYVKWRMRDDVPATIRNCHTVFLSGNGPLVENIDEMFQSAKNFVENSKLVGIVDRFDESLRRFQSVLSHTFPNLNFDYEIKNVTNTSKERDVNKKAADVLNLLDEEVSKLVLEKNKYDIELYNIANKKLDDL